MCVCLDLCCLRQSSILRCKGGLLFVLQFVGSSFTASKRERRQKERESTTEQIKPTRQVPCASLSLSLKSHSQLKLGGEQQCCFGVEKTATGSSRLSKDTSLHMRTSLPSSPATTVALVDFEKVYRRFSPLLYSRFWSSEEDPKHPRVFDSTHCV